MSASSLSSGGNGTLRGSISPLTLVVTSSGITYPGVTAGIGVEVRLLTVAS